MTRNHLLILSSAAPEYPALLESFRLPDLQISVCQTSAEAREVIGDANMVLGNPYLLVPISAEATRLKWVQSTFAGVEALCAPKLRRDYLLTGVKQIYGPLISEYVFGYILSLARRLPQMRQNQLGQRWEIVPYRTVRGQRLVKYPFLEDKSLRQVFGHRQLAASRERCGFGDDCSIEDEGR